MKIHGYCTGCRRFKLVHVSGHQLAIGSATGLACLGTCDACEEEDRQKTINLNRRNSR